MACLCPPGCPAKCIPARLCDRPECPCYQAWLAEMTEMEARTASLTPAQVHAMMLASLELN